jgi:hypothetical protein
MQLKELTLVQLAREIAIDHLDSGTIQELYKLSPEEWMVIQASPRFQKLLESEIVAWQGASNTSERTKLKAGAIIEAWLPESNSRLHDPNESLSAKTELAKLVTNIAGLNKPETIAGGGSGFSVTINLGDKAALQFDKEIPKTIEHGRD